MLYLSFNGREYESPSIMESLRGRSHTGVHTWFLWFKYLLCLFHLVSKYCRLRCNFVFQPMGFLVFCITYSDLAIFSSARQFGSVLQGVSYGSGLPQSTATPVWFLTGSCRRYTIIVFTGVPETLFSRWGELRGQGIIQEVCH